MARWMLREYTLPTLDVVRGSIEWSTINTNNFEIKMTTIQMIQNTLQFKRIMVEDPNKHLKWFLQLCDTFKYNGPSDDAVHNNLQRDGNEHAKAIALRSSKALKPPITTIHEEE
ncbi:Integrase-like protein [Gossypium australe]|uniref:Integrase-like protein n=1 Tax=Gossypium australe TaxID=47621 RepID=A0A5B6WVB8_9ROSI|nr:Integrase-like protein [Gossypium australe]